MPGKPLFELGLIPVTFADVKRFRSKVHNPTTIDQDPEPFTAHQDPELPTIHQEPVALNVRGDLTRKRREEPR